MVLLKITAVFFMGMAVGVMYRIPRQLLLAASLVGVSAWLVFYFAALNHVNIIFGSFLASLTVGFIAELLARRLRKPATVFTIPGFIPLVPGREAYTTMLHMVKGDYIEGLALGMQTLLIAGAIAFGIFLSATIYRLVVNYRVGGGLGHAGKN